MFKYTYRDCFGTKPATQSLLAKRLLHQEKDPLSQSMLNKSWLAQARFPAFQSHRVDDVFLSNLIGSNDFLRVL